MNVSKATIDYRSEVITHLSHIYNLIIRIKKQKMKDLQFVIAHCQLHLLKKIYLIASTVFLNKLFWRKKKQYH